MWHHDKAKRVVQAYVDEVTEGRGVIMDDRTLDRPYGWVFFYQSRVFLETGDHMHAFAGNAPIIFDRNLGEYRLTGTAHPVEHYLKLYEASLDPSVLNQPIQLRKR